MQSAPLLQARPGQQALAVIECVGALVAEYPAATAALKARAARNMLSFFIMILFYYM